MQSRSQQDLGLPDSIEALGTERFEETLYDELSSIGGELPLDRMCVDGGWPDDDTLELEIASVKQVGGKTLVTVKCKFDEVLPTGCADINRMEAGFGEVEIVFDPAQGRAYIEHEDDF